MTNNNFNDYINELVKISSEVAPNMTINDKNPNVDSEKSVQAKIEEAINSNQEDQPVKASLDGFKLVDNGSKYLSVKHAALADASIGIVGREEFATSKDKAALLKSIVTDAFPQTKIAFEGSFVEPVIEKVARGCDQCEACMINGVFCHETGCPNQRKERVQEDVELESKIEPKKSWLGDMEPPMTDTEPPMAGAEFMEYECPVCKETFEDFDLGQHSKLCPGTPEVMHDGPAISISENMPMAHASDSLAQSMQAEQQNVYASQEKIKTEAVNALVSMLKSQGFGTAKVAEVTESSTGYDVMVTVDADAALRAVSIPVTVKEGKVVLPKKSLVSELVSKGLDIQAKLAESFSQEVLNKIAETEARIQYEAQEAQDIINEKVASLDKISSEPKTQFMGTNEQVILNKHLISADVSNLEIGDTVHVEGISYRLVSKSKDVLSKGEDDGSQWTFEKVTPVSK